MGTHDRQANQAWGIALLWGGEADERDLARLATELATALEGALLAARRLENALGGGPGACPHRAVCPGCASATRAAGTRRPTERMPVRLAALSLRENEVLGLLATGHSNREIARALCLSPRTVQRHIANAYLKIGAHNKADATTYAVRHGLA
jgi:DNA-binding CsgD family transcriptional regulator